MQSTNMRLWYTEEVTKSGSPLPLGKNSFLSKIGDQRCDPKRLRKKVIITIGISTETDLGDYESGYENSSGETTEPSVKQRRVYSLDECCNLAEITLKSNKNI